MAYIKACLLTVITECAYFWLLGYRGKYKQSVIALSNVVTNLSLNTFLSFVPWMYYRPWIFIPEAIVVAVEYLIYRYAFESDKLLLFKVFLANVITYSLGVLLEALNLL
jgi:hypothetical protein